ncbi:ABC transporter substrate-binding protein [Sporosarcina sp. E16_8]|uniref:ABC transporter substrate-binding protein n=1 Tax=Sporosarcina sp. E16_8 TaxID=2789295 RepID=UPI001A91A5AA|nr:ABC transporter substrate-binding protein [Sporosarcina sp. E16_8]MBO0588483.1 ABC transporter substrate-binding protein [Sporosarcina sp. E16_8]
MKICLKKMAVVVFGAALLLAACGDGEKIETSTNEDTKKYKIGVTQIVEHPSLNAAYDGFKKAIEDAGLDVEYLVQNAQNDNSANTTIATNLVNSGVDLIFANSTPSAQAVASATQEIPIVFTSVTDAVGAELVDSLESPGGNVTGTIDLHPDVIPQTLKFLKEQLGAKNIGMIFNSGEQNARAQMDKAKVLALDMDITIVEASVATSADVKQAVDSLVGKVDALYIIKDNTVVSALETVTSVAYDNKLPMMVGELDSVKRGGLAAYGFNYHELGYETGQMAVKILKGESKPSELPVQVPKNLKFVINEDTASKIGLEIKEEWQAERSE